jgi:hypothetical protein
MLKQYLEEHPEAWGNRPENKELLREQSPSVQQHRTPRLLLQTSAPGSDHLAAGKGIICKFTDLQQKSATIGPFLLFKADSNTERSVTNICPGI